MGEKFLTLHTLHSLEDARNVREAFAMFRERNKYLENSTMSSDDNLNQDLRIFACDIIQETGQLLRLSQVVISTAQMLFQRVYHTQDFTFDKYPLDITAIAAIFLAAKIEENPKKSRDVMDKSIYVICQEIGREIVLRRDEYETIREEIITTERRILKNLGFNLLSGYPHKLLVSYYTAIVHNLDPEEEIWDYQKRQKLLQLAWNYCNDSSRMDISIKYSEEAVACACIQMACEKTGMLFPKSTDGREWHQLFVEDPKEVEGAIKMLEELYKRILPNPRELGRHTTLYNFRADKEDVSR